MRSVLCGGTRCIQLLLEQRLSGVTASVMSLVIVVSIVAVFSIGVCSGSLNLARK